MPREPMQFYGDVKFTTTTYEPQKYNPDAQAYNEIQAHQLYPLAGGIHYRSTVAYDSTNREFNLDKATSVGRYYCNQNNQIDKLIYYDSNGTKKTLVEGNCVFELIVNERFGAFTKATSGNQYSYFIQTLRVHATGTNIIVGKSAVDPCLVEWRRHFDMTIFDQGDNDTTDLKFGPWNLCFTPIVSGTNVYIPVLQTEKVTGGDDNSTVKIPNIQSTKVMATNIEATNVETTNIKAKDIIATGSIEFDAAGVVGDIFKKGDAADPSRGVFARLEALGFNGGSVLQIQNSSGTYVNVGYVAKIGKIVYGYINNTTGFAMACEQDKVTSYIRDTKNIIENNPPAEEKFFIRYTDDTYSPLRIFIQTTKANGRPYIYCQGQNGRFPGATYSPYTWPTYFWYVTDDNFLPNATASSSSDSGSGSSSGSGGSGTDPFNPTTPEVKD